MDQNTTLPPLLDEEQSTTSKTSDAPHNAGRTQSPTNSPDEAYIGDPAFRVTGMDFILHNMNADAGFITFRKWFEDDTDTMLARVASHVEKGLYSIISLQLSKHSCVVVCASEKKLEDFPGGVLTG